MRTTRRFIASLLFTGLVIAPSHVICHPNSETGRGVVVWIISPDEESDERYEHTAPLLEELGVAMVVELAGTPPSLGMAMESRAVHRALAVVWHDELGGLNLLFTGEGTPERLSTSAGPPNEEALYVREVLLARLELGDLIVDELITVPGEILEPPPPRPPPPPARVLDSAPRIGSQLPRAGGRLGIGYSVRTHFDQVVWSQHGLVLHLPTWRFDNGLILRLMTTIGLPASIGDTAQDRLEVRSIGGVVGAAWVPLVQRWFEFELGGGVGFERTSAVAFLSTGRTQDADHVSGQATVWAALLWHPTPGMDIRLHLNGAYLLRTPSYSINGDGDFASHPWQPGAGIDLAAAIF